MPSARGGEPASGREPYEIEVPGPVGRVISEELPEGVAWAVLEFINGPLLENPRRVGTPLRGELTGFYSAHLSVFRIRYKIDEENHAVTVRDVKHRRDAYGPGSHP